MLVLCTFHYCSYHIHFFSFLFFHYVVFLSDENKSIKNFRKIVRPILIFYFCAQIIIDNDLYISLREEIYQMMCKLNSGFTQAGSIRNA